MSVACGAFFGFKVNTINQKRTEGLEKRAKLINISALSTRVYRAKKSSTLLAEQFGHVLRLTVVLGSPSS